MQWDIFREHLALRSGKTNHVIIHTIVALKKKEQNMHNISRIDQHSKNTFGWFVRIRRDGNKVSRFFSDGKYGGKEESLEEARTYRDENLGQWVKFAKNPDRTMHLGKKTNVGHPGIRYMTKIKKRNKKGDKEHFFQISYSPERGVHRLKIIKIPPVEGKREFTKLYKEKLEKAIRFRDQQMLKVFGARYVNYKKRREHGDE